METIGGDAHAHVHGYGWAGLWSAVASLIFLWSMVQQYVPAQLEEYLTTLSRRLHAAVSPYVTITIDEQVPDSFGRSEAYLAAEAYLSATCASSARRLRADLAAGSDRMSVAVDDHEEVIDEFRGAKLWWRKTKTLPRTNVISWSAYEAERRTYCLTFHHRHRGLIDAVYMPHVLAEGRAATVRNRQRRLFTNNPSSDWSGWNGRVWSHVKLEHPSTFATLGMHPAKKQDIIDDLEMFRDGKDYYASVGKAWKRGYLLFGPPGTGKSTMIAAMANYLDYDVYDLELTAVKNNTELRRLFIETTGKSIIVIEDIDCSIDLTGKRKTKKKKKDKSSKKNNKMAPPVAKDEENKVTLSGLLNFIDGLWSACGGERIIVFTTNHKEKLDPALIRRGRMDSHIEMSYCCFESFKVLAKNYLHIADHELFPEIQQLLGEVDMSPADVAENLMPKSKAKDVDASLGKLIKALKEAKEEALAKASIGAENEEEAEEDDSSSSSEEEKNGKNKND
ncbi:AAA-ATPase ASD, mitochondrial-like [Lolium rigidum]|uniref:AAA-ATPase ASD, mitochondrial-like n=1 Tax=Lolium rigidum TaxID=89674 RepID=UPI001F5D2B0A|nr:AAA-ATPase ASD, mitochondrial-like [Lolium rigidum]